MASSPGRRSFTLWALTIVITLSSVVYQKMTGPTYPVHSRVVIGGEVITCKLPRSQATTSDAIIKIPVDDTHITGEMAWRRFRSNDEWSVEPLAREGEYLVARVPRQPAAGKVMYQISLTDSEGLKYLMTEEPVIIRFKGAVPLFILIPHVLFMFSAMLVSTRAGLEAIARGANAYRYAVWATVLLFLGGIILGPIVQKFAFDAYWTGWPIGHDLTDNKTAFALLFWLIALWRGKDPERGRIWFIVAAVVQLLVYLIPHSVLGSEIDYTKMK